jgi:acyl carrier protein
MSTFAEIQAMLTSKFDVKPELIQPDAKLVDLGLDSLSIAELIFDIGEKYDIEIPEDDLEFQTPLKDAVALVDKLRAAKAA